MGLLVCLSGVAAAGPSSERSADGRPGLKITTTQAMWSRTPDARTLSYELHATNGSQQPLRLASLTVGCPGRPWLQLSGDAMRAATEGAPDGRIAPGRRAVVYVDAPGPERTSACTWRQVIMASQPAVGGGEAPGRPFEAVLAVSGRSTPAFGPPVRGGAWVSLRDPAMARGHRRVVHAIGGRETIPGRFAIDLERLDETGRLRSGDPDDPASYFANDEDVLAVADGVIVGVRDGVDDPPRRSARPPVALADEAGNYIALQVGRGRVVFYEHLRRGVRVRVGQRVKRGCVIGKVGFTGAASEPHLHIHLAGGRSPLSAEGRPFAFVRIEVLGRYPSISAALSGEPWRPLGVGRFKRTYPDANSVIAFPSSPRLRPSCKRWVA